MRKISLTIIGIYFTILNAFSQSASKDTSGFRSRKLRLNEVNIVSSYYDQTADKSSVTGGNPGPIGNGDVTDLSNGLEIKMIGWDGKGRENFLTGSLGIDYHTAASQAYVDSNGHAKSDGTRIYPTLDWAIENEAKGTQFGIGAYYSAEHNYYHSIGLNSSFSKKTHRDGEFTFKLTGYFDNIKMIRPSELIPVSTLKEPTGAVTDSIIYITTASGRTEALSYNTGQLVSKGQRVEIPSNSRDSYTASFEYSQVINSRMQGAILIDLAYQTGYLGLPFHRVYFADSSRAMIENLPASRFKLPIGFRLNYFLGDNIIIRTYYRFYFDSWGLKSNTASIEVPLKITPFISVSPFYRFYEQSAVKYFAPYGVHTAADKYYTSNYALSAFTANYLGLDFRMAPPKGIFKKYFNSFEIRYGHYMETTDLVSNVISLNLKFKP